MPPACPADGFLPHPAAARALDAAVRGRLADSLEELAQACSLAVALDAEAVRRKAGAIRTAGRLPPDMFLQYYAALIAARRDDPEALAVILEDIARTEMVPVSHVLVRALDDSSLPPTAWARYRDALRVESDADLVLQGPPPAMLVAAVTRLSVAREMLAAADPALAAEVEALVCEVVFAQAVPGSPRSFGGATSFQAWGVTFLNAATHANAVAVAVSLVHEAAHALLMGLSGGEPMVLNDPGERHASPLRADPRPLDGILHATFVSARMCYAADRLLSAGVLDTAATAKALRARDASVRAFDAGLPILERHARPTPAGARAISAAAAYMRSRPTSESGSA